MSVRSKGKRKIVRNGRLFYWKVGEDLEDEGRIKLRLISDDRRLVVTYEVGQSASGLARPMMVIEGKEFAGLEDREDVRCVVRTPVWDDAIITPGLVGTIIDWCAAPKESVEIIEGYNAFEALRGDFFWRPEAD
ncbi:hypothetical protein QWJ34_15895 [Saccharibacillus sp. CPCC 101409]|uniref:hypothetical protein n=1 Tax=Saccharibacillus sp. CPCC 101409 TaxID=3058041 RepID=UPI002673C018|nr:hypothetical protein [Saccharibacillus sp. CPCC 101409]MDO3411248.1 hypothetical protein [Saccharibacillus sp. CPCC 101409]